MLTKNQIKYITQLKQKKHRDFNNVFIAEGFKVIDELTSSHLTLVQIYTTDKSLKFNVAKHLITEITNDELKKISCLSTPNICVAIFEKAAVSEPNYKGLQIALDDIRDPGNLGTIIRLCDWFGVKDLICSDTTVDMYNPKVVQATMGSLTRVNIHYTNLENYLKNAELPIYGTFMNGKNIYKSNLPNDAIIVMGNEANGISAKIEALITEKIAIPRFGDLQLTESLNVATATAITLSEFRRINI